MNFSVVNDGVTEIFIYNDIAESQSLNWWTGENGEEITPLTFLKELNSVSTPEICIRINCYGGALSAANTMATHIKEAIDKGKKVTCKIDGICASAAVTVALACENISIPVSACIAIHKPMNAVCGYYNATEHRKFADNLDPYEAGMIAEYAKRTGLSEEECSKMVEEAVVMDGKTAVEKGFADELMFVDEQIVLNTMKLAFVNKAISPPKALQAAFNHIKNIKIEEGDQIMDIKTVTDLKTNFPEIVNQAEETSKAAGADAERKRMLALDALQGKVPQDILNKAKYETFDSPEKVALDCMTNGTFVNSAVLNALEADAASANGVSGAANAALDADPVKAQKKADAEYAKNISAGVFGTKGGK